MAATGTLTLTQNSTTVTGSGTAFTTALAVGGFIVATVGGTGYTLGIKSIESNTSLTLSVAYNGPTASGVAFDYVPQATLNLITSALAAQVTYALRVANMDKNNWQQVYSASGNITVTLPDGSQYSGPSWNSITTSLNAKANTSDVLTKADNLASVASKATAWNNIAQYGTTSTTAARGDDGRLSTVNNKTGGTITSQVFVNGAITSNSASSAALTNQGIHMLWNEASQYSGAGSLVINPGTGTGGLRVRCINQGNTAETASYFFSQDGIFSAPNGSFSLNSRVRAFSALAANYLEVRVDGSGKGINFFDSDERLKENVKDADEKRAMSILESMRPVSYKFKDYKTTYYENDPDTGDLIEKTTTVKGAQHGFGVIAQEYEQIHPEGVITNSDGMKSLDPLEQIGFLMTVCHAQQKTITSQNSRLDELEARLKAIDGLDK